MQYAWSRRKCSRRNRCRRDALLQQAGADHRSLVNAGILVRTWHLRYSVLTVMKRVVQVCFAGVFRVRTSGKRQVEQTATHCPSPPHRPYPLGPLCQGRPALQERGSLLTPIFLASRTSRHCILTNRNGGTGIRSYLSAVTSFALGSGQDGGPPGTNGTGCRRGSNTGS